jgi:hypothetical protein
MATIRPLDMRLIEDAFQMSGGYVLDFSNRDFAQFFQYEAGIAIYDDRYVANGNSKANRLRTFLSTASDPLTGHVLRALWEFRDAASGGPANDDKTRKEQERFFQIVHALDGKEAPPKPKAAASPPGPASPSSQALADLNQRLLDLTAMQPQARGFAFESFLSGLFGAYKLDPRRSFRDALIGVAGACPRPQNSKELLRGEPRVRLIAVHEALTLAVGTAMSDQVQAGDVRAVRLRVGHGFGDSGNDLRTLDEDSFDIGLPQHELRLLPLLARPLGDIGMSPVGGPACHNEHSLTFIRRHGPPPQVARVAHDTGLHGPITDDTAAHAQGKQFPRQDALPSSDINLDPHDAHNRVFRYVAMT